MAKIGGDGGMVLKSLARFGGCQCRSGVISLGKCRYAARIVYASDRSTKDNVHGMWHLTMIIVVVKWWPKEGDFASSYTFCRLV